MSHFLQNVRFGGRMLSKNPGFTLIAVISLAIGIGANTAIFSLVDKLLRQTLAVIRPNELVLVTAETVNPKFLNTIFSYPDYVDYRDRSQTFDGLVAFSQTAVNLRRGDDFQRVNLELVSGNYFEVLGVSALQGRLFHPEDNETPGAHPLAVMSYGMWQHYFGGDPKVVGKTVTLNESSYTVIGIAPGNFKGMHLESPVGFWVPLMMEQQLSASPVPNFFSRTSAWLRIVGRLKSELPMAQAQVELDTLARQIRDANTPERDRSRAFYERRMLLEPVGRGLSLLRANLSKPLTLLLAVVGLVLLIACANVANLMLARSTARRKEMAVRLALGATRFRLASQLLTESLMLALFGGITGLFLAPWLAELLLKFQGQVNIAETSLADTLDFRTLGFTLLVSILCGLVFGLAPSLKSSKPDLIPALKDEVSTFGGRESRLTPRNLLVVAQVALSLMVLIGAGLFIKSLFKLFDINVGFQADKVLLVPIDLPTKSYDENRGGEFYKQLRERLQALPGVEAVSSAVVVPMSGNMFVRNLKIEGYETQPGETLGLDTNEVGPGYHELMGIPLLEGRGFGDQDRQGSPRVAIINETFARRYFQGQQPIGKHLTFGSSNKPVEIIGVARDSKLHNLTETPIAHFETAREQEEYATSITLHVRTRLNPDELIPAVRREINGLDSTLAVANIHSLSSEINNSIATMRMVTTLTALFGAIALLLASIGLYGVMAYSVNRRVREIGIRLALGAQSGDVLKMVLREGMALVAVGLMIGLGGAIAAARLTEELLYGVSATDPLTFAAVALILTGVALVACLVPARRAAKTDPMIALRYE